MGGSNQPTRSPTPQPAIAPASALGTPAQEQTEAEAWGIGTNKGKMKQGNAKAPTDSLASEMEDNFEEALETPAGGNTLDDAWGQHNAENQKTGITSSQTPTQEKKDLVDVAETANAGDVGAGGAQDGKAGGAQEANPEDEWALPVKMKKKKSKKGGEDTDQDAATGAESTTKKKKKGKK